jgi:hypothetical protein
MKTLILALTCVVLAGCTQLRQWATEQAKTAAIEYLDGPAKDRIEGIVEEKVGDEFTVWKGEADTDDSGDATWAEWKAWLISGGGGVTFLAWLLARLRGQQGAIETLAAKQSRKRGEQWAAHGTLEGRVVALEAHPQPPPSS